eukprot:210042_1
MYGRNRRDRQYISQHQQLLSVLYYSNNDNDIITQQVLDRIHCHFFHTFDVGYKLTKKERESVLYEEKKANDDNDIDTCKTILQFNTLIRSKKLQIGNINIAQNNKFVMYKHSVSTEWSAYSYGIRYFYWKHYKHNYAVRDVTQPDPKRIMGSLKAITIGDMEYNETPLSIPSANGQYSLRDWYISCKYENLREELLNNQICTIALIQYKQLLKMAVYHQSTDMVRKLSCPLEKETAHVYELNSGDFMGLDHLIAMMVQCNFEILQNQLRKTYRRSQPNETDKKLKERHQMFYWLGRRLRECVECFGMNRYAYGKENMCKLWHGIDKTLVFSSMFAYIKGPCSTTTDYGVSLNFSQGKGMIVELDVNNDKWTLKDLRFNEGGLLITRDETGWHKQNTSEARYSLFDCSWLSAFSNECEVFTIGGLYKFVFNDIIDIANGEQYVKYVNGIKQISYCMSNGGFISQVKPTTKNEKQMVYRLLSHELHEYYPHHEHAHEFRSCPGYIRKVLHEHCAGIKKIVFPQNDASPQVLMILFKDSNDWIKLNLLCTVFPMLETIYFNASNKNISVIQTICKTVCTFINNNKDTALNWIEVLLHESLRNMQMIGMDIYKKELEKCNWGLVMSWSDVWFKKMYGNRYSMIIVRKDFKFN